MRYSLAPLALAALAVASPAPQGVTASIAPSSSAPAGCSPNYSGSFQIQVVNVTHSAGKAKRQADTSLVMTLSGGVLKDSKGRTGYIAANQQFQFDGPPQTGAVYTAGWSVCQNSSLAIGDNAVFYQCLSGTFYNLYDENTAAQCSPIYIEAVGAGGSGSARSDGQVTASPGAASQLSDGQVTASPVSQISDGQIQATTAGAAPVSQISDGQIQATTATAAPVSQISDGQIQATTAGAAPVSQISDGQIQATTAGAAPVSQISDGQIQATTGAPVTQISDGQIQASTAAASPVTQISDGQIQAPTGVNGTVASPTASVLAYTGAAMPTAVSGQLFGLAAGVLAVAML